MPKGTLSVDKVWTHSVVDGRGSESEPLGGGRFGGTKPGKCSARGIWWQQKVGPILNSPTKTCLLNPPGNTLRQTQIPHSIASPP